MFNILRHIEGKLRFHVIVIQCN